jgi:hypothetical protein
MPRMVDTSAADGRGRDGTAGLGDRWGRRLERPARSEDGQVAGAGADRPGRFTGSGK